MWFDTSNFKYPLYRVFFDGSLTGSAAGGGWILFGARTVNSDALEEWQAVASLSFAMPKQATITACELEACVWVEANTEQKFGMQQQVFDSSACQRFRELEEL